MFDFGFWELALIAVIALIVVGPDRLPSLARTLGLWFGKARGMMLTLRDEIEREIELDEVRRIHKETTDDLKSAGEDVRESIAAVSGALGSGPSAASGQDEAAQGAPAGASGSEPAQAPPEPASADAAASPPPPEKPRRTRKPAARSKATAAKRAAGTAKRTKSTAGTKPVKSAKTAKTVKKTARAKAKPTPPAADVPADSPEGGQGN